MVCSALNIYDLYKEMFDNRIVLVYQGAFDQAMVKSVISMTEKKLIQDNADESLRKKLFNVMVESLQNICKHQFEQQTPGYNPFLIISHENDCFNLLTGNLIYNPKVNDVKSKIDRINAMNKEELKEFYKAARLNSVISEVGGAGLGFIDIVRKAGNPIEYEFYSVNTEFSFFIQKIKVTNNN